MYKPFHEKAFEIFGQACDIPHGERTDFVDEACGDDAELRTEVFSLLLHDESPANLDAAVLEPAQDLLSTTANGDARLPSAPIPERIGNYRVIRKLGEGGMGEVYEAEQDSPKRRVALKVVRAGRLSPGFIKRFEREAFVLGRLQHPGIAHIYESGMIELHGQTQPFFVMELIDGVRITAHARRSGLGIRQRMELIARVTDAVQHSHQKAIIHRDLKPANILVVEQGSTVSGGSRTGTGTLLDAIGQPKILDFGVARITDADVQAATMQTDIGQMIGTLAYMSPEQVAGDPRNLDTRCDVYALGVILFELLTDRLPLNLAGKSVAEAARIIREEDPILAGTLDRALRGDVETIIAKALEKNPDGRYTSAAEFAGDIRRYLQDEPIGARRASTFYQISKLASRNRGLVGGLVATFVALVVGLIGTGYFLVESRAQTKEANTARKDADREKDAAIVAREASDEVTTFLTDMLSSANPDSLGKDVSVREVLDLVTRDIGRRFEERPQIEARVRTTMGRTYLALGEFDLAEEHHRRAIELWTGGAGESTLQSLGSRVSLAQIRLYRGEYEGCLNDLDSAIAELRELDDSQDRIAMANAKRGLAMMKLGRFAAAEQVLRESISQLEASHGPDAQEVFAVATTLTQVFLLRGSEETEPLLLDLIHRSRENFGNEHPTTLQLVGSLGTYYQTRGRSKDAIPYFRETREIQTRILGESHRQTLISTNNLAQVLARSGQPAEAQELLDGAMKLSISEHGEESPTTLFLAYTLGVALRSAGELDRAEDVMRRSLKLHRRVQGPDSDGTYAAHSALLNLLIARKDYDKAIVVGEDLIDHTAAQFPDEHSRLVQVRYNVGRTYIGVQKYDKAEETLLAAHKGKDRLWKTAIERKLVQLYNAWDKPDEAARWQTMADAAAAGKNGSTD